MTLRRRIEDLEARDDELTLIRKCPSCGELALAVEAHELPPRCARGEAHSPIPAPTPRDIAINPLRHYE